MHLDRNQSVLYCITIQRRGFQSKTLEWRCPIANEHKHTTRAYKTMSIVASVHYTFDSPTVRTEDDEANLPRHIRNGLGAWPRRAVAADDRGRSSNYEGTRRVRASLLGARVRTCTHDKIYNMTYECSPRFYRWSLVERRETSLRVYLYARMRVSEVCVNRVRKHKHCRINRNYYRPRRRAKRLLYYTAE